MQNLIYFTEIIKRTKFVKVELDESLFPNLRNIEKLRNIHEHSIHTYNSDTPLFFRPDTIQCIIFLVCNVLQNKGSTYMNIMKKKQTFVLRKEVIKL